MRPHAIVDTGPLVAYINARENLHNWVLEQCRTLTSPLITCEAVLTEAFYLLQSVPNGVRQLSGLLTTGAVQILFSLHEELATVCELMAKYADRPMSLADACLVRMSEISPDHRLLTLDGDFNVYRRFRNNALPLMTPA